MSKFTKSTDEPLQPAIATWQQLPAMLLSLLERRYLSEFAAGNWVYNITSEPSNTRLRELLAIGGEDKNSPSMAATLAAWHEPGQSIVTMIQGETAASQRHRHRIFYGSRRMPGGPAADTFLESQCDTLAAHFSGLELAKPIGLNALQSTTRFLQTAPALGVITGIPSPLMSHPSHGLERLVRTIGSHGYVISVVAEPVSFASADAALDACRRLQSDISLYVSRSLSRTRGESETEDRTEVAEQPAANVPIPAYLQQCAGYVSAATGQPVLGIVAHLASRVINSSAAQPNEQQPVVRETKTENWSESASVNYVDAVAHSCQELLLRYVERMQSGRGWGWWRTTVYVAAENEAALESVGRAVRAAATGDTTNLDPLRMTRAPASLLREAMIGGRIIGLRPAGEALFHPLGEDYDSLATCVTSEELGALIAPPRSEIPGIPIRRNSEFAVTLPTSNGDAFELGRVKDVNGAEHGPAFITQLALNEHVLVTGTPGSGKTNTCMHLLLSAWKSFNIPFLVVEPAKAEYRQLKRQLGERLRVLSIGGGGVPLRLNPLAPVTGARLLGHIDLLKAVFNASFSMHPGMPQILEQAMLETYYDRGWDLQSGKNDVLSANATASEIASLTPCLSDLHEQVELVMERKGYAGEVRMNMGAALRSRLNGLMLGAKGASLNVRRSTPDSKLFNEPVVLELSQLRDDDEKAFVMAVVFMRLYQYCEVRQTLLPAHRREQLQHVTLIEEAHRLLAGANQGDGETAGSRAKAVSMFTDMLAELRALGEGFMIAEQIPTKLANDTLKNTNLKIIHRLTALSERSTIGRSVNLNDAQIEQLANLSKGLAVVHGVAKSSADPMAEPAMVQVTAVKSQATAAESELVDVLSQGDLELARRHGGCDWCVSPCDFYHRIEPEIQRSPLPSWARNFAEAVLTNNSQHAWERWSIWRRRRAIENARPGDDYCWFVHVARHWINEVLRARGGSQDGGRRFRPEDRIAADRLASLFGKLTRIWIDEPQRNDATDRVFIELGDELRATLFDGMPPDFAGCQRCPARCKMLPFVSGVEREQVSRSITELFHQPNAPAFPTAKAPDVNVYRRKLSLAMEPYEAAHKPVNVDADVWKRDFRYCLVTTIELPAEFSGRRAKLLELIYPSEDE